MIDKFLNVKQVAGFFDVSTTTIFRWCKRDNPLPHYKNGRVIRFKEEEINRWFEQYHKKELEW